MTSTSDSQVYKYRTFNMFALRIFAAKELYFSAPHALNDPIDCQFPIPRFLEEVIGMEPAGEVRDILAMLHNRKVTERATGNLIPMHATFRTLPETAGVLSLSANPTDALLWSHYADGHRGFCVGFNRSYFGELLNDWQQNNLLGASDVNYVDEPIAAFREFWRKKAADVQVIRQAGGKVTEVAMKQFNEDYKREVLVAVLTMKSQAWAYEKEYRAVRAEPGSLRFEPRALVEVIFGLRTPETEQALIKTLLDGPEWAHVRYLRPVCNDATFELSLIDC